MKYFGGKKMTLVPPCPHPCLSLLLCLLLVPPHNRNPTWYLQVSLQVFGCSRQFHLQQDTVCKGPQIPKDPVLMLNTRGYTAGQRTEPEVTLMLLNWSEPQLKIF